MIPAGISSAANAITAFRAAFTVHPRPIRNPESHPPNKLPASAATAEAWRIELPEWCQDQRNQMTGPADDAELVVKMLNSGAPGVMLDL